MDRNFFLDSQDDLSFFSSVSWPDLLEQEAPFVPQPEDVTDTGYFDARNNLLHLRVSQVERL